MSDKEKKITKFNDKCKINAIFKEFRNNNFEITKSGFNAIFEERDSLMELGVTLGIGLFSIYCKKSINNYKKLISKYHSIIKNENALNDFLNKEKGDWGKYLKHRGKLESKEKNNKNLSKAVKEMNENKEIIAIGISKLTINDGAQASSNAPNGPKIKDRLKRLTSGSSHNFVHKVVGNASNASQDRKAVHSPSYNSDKLNPNIPAQSQYGYQHPFNNNIGPNSVASSSYSNLNAQNQYVATESQYIYQPPAVGSLSGGAFRQPVNDSGRGSGSSSSYNNSGWPDSNVTIHSSQNGPVPLKKQSVIKQSAVTASPPGTKKIRRNPSDRDIGGIANLRN